MRQLWRRFRADDRATVLSRAVTFSALGVLSSVALAVLPLAAWLAARDVDAGRTSTWRP